MHAESCLGDERRPPFALQAGWQRLIEIERGMREKKRANFIAPFFCIYTYRIFYI